MLSAFSPDVRVDFFTHYLYNYILIFTHSWPSLSWGFSLFFGQWQVDGFLQRDGQKVHIGDSDPMEEIA